MSPCIHIRSEADIASARDAVRLTANAVAFQPADLRLVLAAVSELCLNALETGGGELLVSELRRSGREGLSIVMKQGRIKRSSAEDCGLGFAGAKRLTDEYTVSIRGDKTIVHAIKWRRLPPRKMTAEYRSLLEHGVAHSGEEPLQRAFAFGRRAVLDGLGALDMMAIHSDSVALLSHLESPHFSTRAQECLEEALAAFEMVYRGFPEARTAMQNINNLLEQEAERIAHSLHDDAGQTIAALQIGIDELDCEHAACILQTRRLKAIVEEAGNLFRGLSHELCPPLLERAGLAPALHALCVSMTSRSGLRVSFRDDLQRRVAEPVELAIYRTAQVGLANVIRHAHAEHATVSVGVSGKSIVCSIRDDGRGMDTGISPNAALGLKGVRERVVALGGTVETEPVRPHGFELRICLPDSDAYEAGEMVPGEAALLAAPAMPASIRERVKQ
jgi:two-component system, NarL family, sensor kinase